MKIIFWNPHTHTHTHTHTQKCWGGHHCRLWAWRLTCLAGTCRSLYTRGLFTCVSSHVSLRALVRLCTCITRRAWLLACGRRYFCAGTKVLCYLLYLLYWYKSTSGARDWTRVRTSDVLQVQVAGVSVLYFILCCVCVCVRLHILLRDLPAIVFAAFVSVCTLAIVCVCVCVCV